MNFDCGVYAIYGPNGRAYIGSSLSFNKRFRTHRRDLKKGVHHCRALQRAYDKYGAHAFTYAKIAIVPASDLLTVEQAQMDDRGGRALYNSSRTAGNCIGVKHSAETRAKWSAARKGLKRSDEMRALMVKLKTGMRYSEETRKKIGDTLSKLTEGKAKSTNTSGYAGVSWHKPARKWTGKCRHNRIRYHVGLFATPEAAFEAIQVFKKSLIDATIAKDIT
jgi:group I intron endonuclease